MGDSRAGQELFTFGVAQWRSEPFSAFDAFLSGYRFGARRLRESTFVIYRGMFRRLVSWAAVRGLDLFALDEQRLEEFLRERELSAETRHRYLLVFMALFTHLAQLQAEEDALANPARVLLLEQEAPERDRPEWLGTLEVSAFLQVLPQAGPWKKIRTRALMATVLGAGLRSAEVLALKTTDVHWQQKAIQYLWVQEHKPHPQRKAPLHHFALEPLQEWLALRESLGIPGELVFVAGRNGAPMTAATLFRQTKALLEEAGISKRYEGPTLLRNTCAALWLKQYPPAEVMQMMGHATLRTTEQFLAH